MNIKEDILTELSKNKYEDDFIKIRYIYLYVCKMFSYDVRFMYADKDLKEEIYKKEIDIENVEDYEIVCYTFAKILVDTLNLFNIDAQIIRENSNTFSHVYVIVKYRNGVLKLDPTKRHDNTRVKLNSSTLDFVKLDDNDTEFYDELLYADRIITNNYESIDTDVYYNNQSIVKLVNIIEDNAKLRKISKSELFFEKLEYIISLVNTRHDLIRYDDIDYYYSYLIRKFNLNDKKFYVKPGIFFKSNDKSMKDIINITLVKYKDFPPLFYLLRKEGKNFKMREIFKDEALELLSQYENPCIKSMFLDYAQSLAVDKNNGIIKYK